MSTTETDKAAIAAETTPGSNLVGDPVGDATTEFVTVAVDSAASHEDRPASIRDSEPRHGSVRWSGRNDVRPRSGRGLVLSLLVACIGGLMYELSFPTAGIWPLAFVGLALILGAQRDRGIWAALLVGFVGGLAFWLPDIDWTALYLGPVPWLALAFTEAVFWGIAGILFTLAWRWVPRAFPGRFGRLGILPLTLAGLWTLREYVTDNWPYQGFAWGRAALSQSLSPFAHLTAWVGLAGLSFIMVWLVAFAYLCVQESLSRAFGNHLSVRPLSGAAQNSVSHIRPDHFALPYSFSQLFRWHFSFASDVSVTDSAAPLHRVRANTAHGATVWLWPIVTALLILAVPIWPTQTVGKTTVAAVQGDGPAGYFQPHQTGAVENAQIEATMPLLDSKTKVNMVLWPEGSADANPLQNAESAGVLTALSEQLNAPFVVGAITQKGKEYFNSSLVWDGAKGATAQYDKQHPVPFGEYIPDRSFYHAIAPSLVDLVQRDYTPGTRPNTVKVGGVLAGISICFDIVDDWQMSQMVRGGAEIILAQTNNADFGRTKENEQQLAIARLRAIESSRSLVNISTAGTSQIISPTGATVTSIPAYKPGLMTATVPLSTTVTPAMVDGQGIELAAAAFGLLSLLLSAFLARPGRTNRSA